MQKLILVLAFLLILAMIGCAPAPLSMKDGEKLDSMLKSNKVKVAILPVADYGEKAGLCSGYGLGGFYGMFTGNYAYENGGREFTNQITSGVWKQNVCFLAKQKDVLAACEKNSLKRNETFPGPEGAFMSCLTGYNKPIESPNDVGNGASPNYEKLYKIGEDLQVDILLTSRLSTNEAAKVCTYGGGGGALLPIPWGYLPGLLEGIYTSFISPTDVQVVQVDLIALDIKNKKVISYGNFGVQEWASSSEKQEKLDSYSKAMVFYFNLPSDETKKKQAIASAASFASTVVTNYVLQSVVGLSMGVTFKFEYDIMDVTWKQQAPDYFEKNYGWSQSEYLRALQF